MRVLTYCGLILAVAAMSFAAPTKTPNACGYPVSKYQDTIPTYHNYNVFL